jgi:serine/threonine protein phosphatase PrpC
VGWTFIDRDMEAPRRLRTPCGDAVVLTARCPGGPGNEDCAAVLPYGADTVVLAVADGMGGQRAGDLASAAAIEALAAALEQGLERELPARTAILDAFEAGNRAVQDLQLGAGTTLAVVEITGRDARAYHAGDSMILALGQRGKLKLQTVSHSPVGFGVEAGLIDEDEALHHEDRHLVSNVLGSADLRIEIGSPIRLAARDTVLLASDGLFDNLTVDEIVEGVRAGPLHRSVAALAERAGLRMRGGRDPELPSKPDDLTVVAFRPARPRRRRPEGAG